MHNLNKTLSAEREHLEQERRRRTLRENQEAKRINKLETRRQIDVGRIFLKYFPEYAMYSPQLTTDENRAELEALENFLSLLSSDNHTTTLKLNASRQSDYFLD